MKLKDFGKDFKTWPSTWEGVEEDVEPGKRMLHEVFLPYFEHLVKSGLTKKTIRKHISNIWLLGGEIVRSFEFEDEDEDLRNIPAIALVLKNVDCGEGPLLSHYQTEEQQRAFDSSCNKLFKFLKSKDSSLKV